MAQGTGIAAAAAMALAGAPVLASATPPAPGASPTAPVSPIAPGSTSTTPVNPSVTPVQVVVQVPAVQAITVRIIRVYTAQVVGTLGPVNAMAGPTTIPWSGGRGPGGTGQPVADGQYRFEGLAADGLTVLPATPAAVTVDMTAPKPVVDVPAPTIPASRRTSLPLRPGGADEVRAIVRRPGDGAPLASGPWVAATDALALPKALARRGIIGTVEVSAEGRDAAGNTGTGDPVIWALQPAAGAPMVVRRIKTKKPLVALTVDDGYGPSESVRMIEAARAAGVTVTFCFNAINGRVWSASFRQMLREAVKDGSLEICNHGYAHNTSESTSASAGTADLSRNKPWDDIAGVASGPFYRPPYGAFGPGLRAAAQATGYRYVLMWDVDTNDWQGPSASVITQRAVGGARRGSIILMHTKPNTAAAFPDIIRGLKRKGLEPVGLGELFAAGRPG
ncbi:MAG: polysaccharide deacetylase family protein [Actinobacteria bacterium]|nr:polysaccharide deacetylase family protein [Actinomycetota bacterium]